MARGVIISLFLLTAVLPHMYLWYLPFSESMDRRTRRQLLMGYGAILALAFFGCIGLYALDPGYYFIRFTKLFYTLIWIPAILLHAFVLPGIFPRHVFVFSMVGLFAFFSHTVATNVYLLFMTPEAFKQHLGFYSVVWAAFMVLFLVPIRPLFRNFFRLHLKGADNYSWRYACLIPLCAYLGEFFYMNWFATYIVGYAFLFPRMMDSLLALALGLATYEGTRVMEQYVLAREKAHREEKQLTYLSTYAASLEDSERQMKIIRHDNRHFLRSLSACLDGGNIEDARALVSEADQDLSRTKIRKICENTVINAALSHFVQEAETKGIPFIAQVRIPNHLKEEIDLSLVLANLTENAFHAAEKEKSGNCQITLIARVENGSLTAYIRNRFEGKITLAEDGLPVTTRKDHGIGMQSVRKFCETYGATVLWKQEGGWVTVYLQCPVTVSLSEKIGGGNVETIFVGNGL